MTRVSADPPEWSPLGLDRYIQDRMNELFGADLGLFEPQALLGEDFTALNLSSPQATQEQERANFDARLHRYLRRHPFRVDIGETADGFLVMAELPGISRDQIQVHLEAHGMLRIDADRVTRPKTADAEEQKENNHQQEESQEKTKSEKIEYHLVERVHSHQHRTIRLPKQADVNNVQSSFENGLLTLKFGKLAMESKQIKV